MAAQMAGHDARWRVLEGRGLQAKHLRALVDELHDSFSADDGGYKALSQISDEMQRAVVSDQIAQSAYAIGENLLEAHLHQKQFTDIVGADGVAMPTKDTVEATVLRGAEMDMAITGCVRAMGSALDCLAATAIGVLRIPRSITKASFRDLTHFTKKNAAQAASPKQRKAWEDWAKLVESHESKPPYGWFDWEQAMRNLNIHRGRQVHTLVQRLKSPEEPQMIVFDRDPGELTRTAARFDLHLRNRPDLPDMQDLITSKTRQDLWISEPATVTLPGILGFVNSFTEEASNVLLSYWRYAEKWGKLFPPPIEKWVIEPMSVPFLGVLGENKPYPVGAGIANPHLAERLKLAEKLRSQSKIQ